MFFRRNSTVSSVSSDGPPANAVPEREEVVSLKYSNNSRFVSSQSILHGVRFDPSGVSVSKIAKNPISRALYIMTLIQHMQRITERLNAETIILRNVFRDGGLLLSENFPPPLRNYYSTLVDKDSLQFLTEVPPISKEDIDDLARQVMTLHILYDAA